MEHQYWQKEFGQKEFTDNLLFIDKQELDEVHMFDTWIREEENLLYKKQLEKLGLCEKKGMDDQMMLYPVKSKERKLEKDELKLMLERLYIKKNKPNMHQSHLNDATMKSLNKEKKQKELQQKKKKKDKQDKKLYKYNPSMSQLKQNPKIAQIQQDDDDANSKASSLFGTPASSREQSQILN